MEVILIENIEKLGKIGDVVRVKDGYARNYLLPRKKVLRSNEENRKIFKEKKAFIESEEKKRKEKSIQITKSILFVILLMAVAVAVFNITSTLVMVVNEKQSDIAILRTLGAKPMSILKIFLNQGSIIGFLGISLGVFIGTFFTLNLVEIVSFFENIFDFKVLAADVYFISDLPTDLRWIDIVKISAITFLLTILATLIPAMNAVRTNPSEVLRYD